MSWLNLNESLNGLKGQFKNLASEVFSEGIVEETGPQMDLEEAHSKIKELQVICDTQEAQIKTLRSQNSKLHQEKLDALAKDGAGTNFTATLQPQTSGNEESTWFWDPPDEETNSEKADKSESQELRKRISELQNEISTLKNNKSIDTNVDVLRKEFNALREENKNLTLNLEDLDNQNQIALNKVITIKRELQKNLEELQKKYDHLEKENNEFKTRLKTDDVEKDEDWKEMTETNMKLISDLGVLHKKYDNLEKVHRLLTENTEKFQEENMELTEENFRLQEECTKLQNDLEELQASSQSAPKYKELESKCIELERKFAEKQSPKLMDTMMDAIHDTKAQEIIAQLKFEIVELQNKLNTNEEIKRLNLEIDHLKKEVETLSKAHATFIPCDSFKTIIDKYVTFDISGALKPKKASADELLKFAESCCKTLADMKSKNETLEIRTSESSRTINSLQSNIDELTAEMEILNGDLSHYEHECSEFKKNNDFLIAEIGALKSVSKLEPILEQNEEHVAKLQCELDDCSKSNNNFKTEMKVKDKRLQMAEEEKNILNEEISRLKVTVSNFEESTADASNADNLQEKLSSILSEVDRLKTQLHSVTVDNEKSKIDLTILDNDKILLLREISELKANLQAKSIVEDYAKKMESEKVALETKLDSLKELESLTNNVSKENENLKNKLTAFTESSESANLINEELVKYMDMYANSTKILDEKEHEIEIIKAKYQSSEHSLKDSKIVLSSLNRNFVTQFKKFANSVGIDADGINLVVDVEDTDACVLNHTDEVFQKVEDFISNLDSKKRDLLEDLLSKNNELDKAVNTNNSLSAEFLQKDTLVKELKEQLKMLEDGIANKSKENSALAENMNKSQIEIKALKEEIALIHSKDKHEEDESNNLMEIINKRNEELSTLKAQKENLSIDMQNQLELLEQELNNVNENLAIKEAEIAMKDEELQTLSENLCSQRNETELMSVKCSDLSSANKTSESNDTSEEFLKLKHEKECLSSELEQAKQETRELKSKIEDLQKKCEENAERIKEFEAMKVDAFNQLDQLSTEKSELINLVTQKHNESVTYHNEIQRLSSVMLTENERYKELERIYAATREQVSNGSHASSEELNRINEILKHKNDKCIELERQLEYIRNSGVTADELEKLREKNQFLIEKCDVLGKNLVMEQGNTRQIVQEKMQILEREQSMGKELERLRQHLVEMEEEHTRELVTAEQKLQEAQMKLSQAEDKVKQSSTIYTSNSIRANQEVETLRTQIKLVEKQRDEIQFQLSQSEDRNSKNLAALTNLQCVLEQFQMDKEREGEAVAGKARRDLEAAREDITKLHIQIADLEEKLRDSSTGLRAASRLSAQLDARTAQVHESKEQVTKLEEELNLWKKKFKDAVSNQQDKVDKSLVKNLLMGYIQTSNTQKPGDRIQVLRLLSTVLDFDQLECERAGLGSKSAATGGDSLAQEFIKFLEKESRPQLKVGLPNLLHLGNPQGPMTPPHTSKSDSPLTVSRASTSSPQRMTTPSPQQPTAIKPAVPLVPMTLSNPLLANASVSPVTVSSGEEANANTTKAHNPGKSVTGGFTLFTPIANPDVVVNQTRNNEGAILKNILKES